MEQAFLHTVVEQIGRQLCPSAGRQRRAPSGTYAQVGQLLYSLGCGTAAACAIISSDRGVLLTRLRRLNTSNVATRGLQTRVPRCLLNITHPGHDVLHHQLLVHT